MKKYRGNETENIEDLQAELAGAEVEIEELKEKLKKTKGKIHDLHNEIQCAIGTLWTEFCDAGPVSDDAMNNCNIAEISHICADAFADMRMELEQTKPNKTRKNKNVTFRLFEGLRNIARRVR